MTQRIRRLLLIAVILAAGALFFAMIWPKGREIALPDGSHLRLRAVTYGTNHIVGTPFERLFAQLPPGLAAVAKRMLPGFNRPQIRQRTSPVLIVWMQWIPKTPVPPPSSVQGSPLKSRWAPGFGEDALRTNLLSIMLADETGFVSGEESWIEPLSVQYLVTSEFRVFPRRGDTLEMRFLLRRKGLGSEASPYTTLKIPNPLYRKYPVWSPEPLPATKNPGDVSVTLEALYTSCRHISTNLGGRNLGYSFVTDIQNKRNEGVGRIRLSSQQDTNEVWAIARLEVADATGNQVRSWVGIANDKGYFPFSPVLWPNESAWKLKVEVKRRNNFAPEELMVFKAVPLGAVDVIDHPALSQAAGGVELTLDEMVRRKPNYKGSSSPENNSWFSFKHLPMAPGMHVDLLRVETDAGQVLSRDYSTVSGDRNVYYYKGVPLEATNLTFTFAVHRSRFVEFIAKPVLATPNETIGEY